MALEISGEGAIEPLGRTFPEGGDERAGSLEAHEITSVNSSIPAKTFQARAPTAPTKTRKAS